MSVCEIASELASSPSMSYASLYTFNSLRPKRVEVGFGDVTVIQHAIERVLVADRHLRGQWLDLRFGFGPFPRRSDHVGRFLNHNSFTKALRSPAIAALAFSHDGSSSHSSNGCHGLPQAEQALLLGFIGFIGAATDWVCFSVLLERL
jgi:hypothetical protein